MTTPFATSSAVLDAAGRGATVPGYEAIGGLLLDLAFTVPVVPGGALASSEVAAACAATAPGRLATLAGLVRPSTIVISLAAAALVAGLVLAPSAQPAVGTVDPARSGVARVVSAPGSEPREPLPVDVAAEVPVDGGPARPIPGSDAADRFAESVGRGDPTRSDPGGSAAPVVPTSGPSTSGPSTLPTTTLPTSTPPTTTLPTTTPSTTAPSTTTVVPHGNNGNENGNGVGNGKGNQGTGTPGGPSGRADSGDPAT